MRKKKLAPTIGDLVLQAVTKHHHELQANLVINNALVRQVIDPDQFFRDEWRAFVDGVTQ